MLPTPENYVLCRKRMGPDRGVDSEGHIRNGIEAQAMVLYRFVALLPLFKFFGPAIFRRRLVNFSELPFLKRLMILIFLLCYQEIEWKEKKTIMAVAENPTTHLSAAASVFI